MRISPRPVAQDPSTPILAPANGKPAEPARRGIMVDTLVHWNVKPKDAQAARVFGGKASCHLSTDGPIEELHAFAARIGLRREWFQDHPKHPHYDLTASRRAAAVRAGAVEMTGREWILAMRAARAEGAR